VSAGSDGIDAAGRVPAAYYDAVITVSAAACTNITRHETTEACAPGSTTFPNISNWGTGSDAAWPSMGTLPVALAAPGASILSTTLGGGTGAITCRYWDVGTGSKWEGSEAGTFRVSYGSAGSFVASPARDC
jgi:hypothetical protein